MSKKEGIHESSAGVRNSLNNVRLASRTIAQVARADKPPFTIIISTPRNMVKSGSDVSLKVTMMNTSDRDIDYTVGTGPIIDIDIRDAGGKPLSETPDGRKIHGTDRRAAGPGSGTVVRVPLKPGKILDGESILNQEYDLTIPGKYTIQAVRADPISKNVVKSNTITVTVTP